MGERVRILTEAIEQMEADRDASVASWNEKIDELRRRREAELHVPSKLKI